MLVNLCQISFTVNIKIILGIAILKPTTTLLMLLSYPIGYCGTLMIPNGPNKKSYFLLKSNIKKSMCACISAIEIQTTVQILMKFGMEVLLNAGKVPGWVATLSLQPQLLDLAKTL